MPNSKVKVEQISRLEVIELSVSLDDRAFVDAINSSIVSVIDMSKFAVKSVTFKVPGGGDWYNMSIPLSDMEFSIVIERRVG